MGETSIEEIKKSINNIIWMYAPKETTLEKAEDAACKMLRIFEEL